MSETSSQTIIERFFAALNDSDMDALLAAAVGRRGA